MKKRKIFKISSFLFLLLIVFLISYTFADLLDNDVEVEINSELTYYLNIKYDGIDVFGESSSDAKVSEVNSDILFVEDKLPEGLTFTGFVVSNDGTIGAVERNNTSVSCLGTVVDDTNESGNEGMWINNNQEFVYHGLHYNASTRTVSFKVENLKAGCVLTVGIKTQTPAVIDDSNTVTVEKRRDFYNVATLSEKVITVFSNVVHSFMGKSSETLYTVTYEYEAGTSSNAPSLPPTMSYSSGSLVNIANDIRFEGYSFNGWTSNDVSITNGKFEMPSNNIVIKGSFTPVSSYKVIYSISGTTPSDYSLPVQKSYYSNSLVNVDSLKAGDVVNGYVFNGWTSNDVNISNGRFTMPNSDVSIVGSFSKITYSVSYQFQGAVIPSNSQSLLPATTNYEPGDVIQLESVSEPSGYKFLGWNKDEQFIMPSENVIIYGEWKRFNGYYLPSISISVENGKNYYKPGDIIKYKITVNNSESYSLKDVILKEKLSGAYFVEGIGYTVSSTMAIIDEIKPNSSFDVYAEYQVKETDNNNITNSVEIKSGSSDNFYELANGSVNANTKQIAKRSVKNSNTKSGSSSTLSASVTSALQSTVEVCVEIDGFDIGNYFQIKLFNSASEYWLLMKNNECMEVNVDPGTYSIFELLPQGYTLDSVVGNISSNNSSLVVGQSTDYHITFNNKFRNSKFIHAFGSLADTIEGGE